MANSYVQNYVFDQATKKVMSQTQGLYPAPLKILDVNFDKKLVFKRKLCSFLLKVLKQTFQSGSKVGYNAEAEVIRLKKSMIDMSSYFVSSRALLISVQQLNPKL